MISFPFLSRRTRPRLSLLGSFFKCLRYPLPSRSRANPLPHSGQSPSGNASTLLVVAIFHPLCRVPLILPRRQDKNHRRTVAVALWTRRFLQPDKQLCRAGSPPGSKACFIQPIVGVGTLERLSALGVVPRLLAGRVLRSGVCTGVQQHSDDEGVFVVPGRPMQERIAILVPSPPACHVPIISPGDVDRLAPESAVTPKSAAPQAASFASSDSPPEEAEPPGAGEPLGRAPSVRVGSFSH